MSRHSSKMTVPKGKHSAIWQAMERHNVDLYFAGEVHATSAQNHGDVEQVLHGGWIAYTGQYIYLTGTVRGKQLALELHLTRSTPDRVRRHHLKLQRQQARL